MTSDEQQLMEVVQRTGRMGNQKARATLGWSEEQYRAVRDALVAQGLVAYNRGIGGGIRLVEPSGQLAAEPLSQTASGLCASTSASLNSLDQITPVTE